VRGAVCHISVRRVVCPSTFVIFVAIGQSILAATPVAAGEVLKSELVFSSGVTPPFTLTAPLFGAAPVGDFGHLYIAEQRRASLLRLDLQTKELIEVLDLPNPGPQPFDTGFNGFAFSPDFANNGKVYVQLSGSEDQIIRILEYTRSATNPNVFDPATRREILQLPNPGSSHNGGWIGFGPQDGYLYVATGDGGSFGLPSDGINAQDVNSLQGKMLRIDVDGEDFYPADDSRNYAIPATNPFATGIDGAPEVFAYGLRHPFRNSFDRETGDLYIGDVGSHLFEEIDFLPAGTNGGQNYGWRAREGFLDNPDYLDAAPANAIDPIYAYPHVSGASSAVIGGYVYRGNNIPSLQGTYFFDDWASKIVSSFRYDGNNVTEFVDRTQELMSPLGRYGSIASFAEDAAGELYIVDYATVGRIYRIARRNFVSADFDSAEVPNDLEQSSLNTAALFDGSTATFPGVGEAGRSYLRTIDDDLHTTSFTAEVTVTLNGTGSGFFGLGEGDPHSEFSQEPRTGAHVFMRVDPSALGGNALLVDNGSDIDPATNNEVGDGIHRLRINYNASTKRIQFVIGDLSSGRFVPTNAFSTIDTSNINTSLNSVFAGSNARLFFGGADGITFDDLSHRYFEGLDSLWTGASDSAYGTTSNWSSEAVPNDSTNLYFTDTAATFTVDLGGDRTANSATFAGTSGYTLNNNTLSLTTGDVAAVGSAVHTINSNITILSDGVWEIGVGTTLTLNGNLSDGGGGFDIEKIGGGSLNFNGSLNSFASALFNGGTVNASSGAAASVGDVDVGTVGDVAGTSAFFTISGAGSSVTQIGNSTLTVGSASGLSGTLSLIDGGTPIEGFATGTGLTRINPTGLIDINPGGSTSFRANGDVLVDGGILQRQSGSFSWAPGKTMTVQNGGRVLLGNQTTIVSDNSIYVTGNGSLLSLSDGELVLSNDSELHIATGGAFMATGNSMLMLNDTSVVNITDGIAVLGNLVANGGAVNFNSGSLSYGGDLTVGSGGLLGSDLVLASNRTLSLSGNTTVDSFHALTLDGGTLNTSSLVVNGTFLFNSGTLGITGAEGLTIGNGGPLETTLALGAGRTLRVTHTTTVNSGSILAIDDGASFSSETIANNGTVALNGVTSVLSGTTFNNAGLLHGEGRVVAAFANQTDAEVRAETGELLTFEGAQNDNAGRINLLGGTVEFDQSLTNGETGQVLGHGNLIVGGLGITNHGQMVFSNATSSVFGDLVNDTGDDAKGITVTGNANMTFWDDVTHNADSLLKVSSGSSATFLGTFDGTGSIVGGGDVYFEADLTPGSSPAEVTYDANVYFGNEATANMEIAGIMLGTQYDRLIVSGELHFGGTLEVTTISSFVPGVGDSFDIFDWGTADGAFATLDLPALEENLMWNAEQLYITGTLRVVLAGDYNGNGIVDAGDYTVWRNSLGRTGVGLAADGNGNNQIDAGDFGVWEANFGATAGSGSGANANAAVPEPATLMLIILAAAGVYARRRRCAWRVSILISA